MNLLYPHVNTATTKNRTRMGCGTSTLSPDDIAGIDLKLPNSKLKFGVGQMKTLNKKLAKINEDLNIPFLSDDAESVAERLIQGLVCGAAAKDPRFKSKFIVVLHKDRICKSSSLEYLVLLDELDGNCAFAEGPAGCARIRPQEHMNDWQEFLTASGFLRRDKVIERWVEILAAAAADGVIGSGDESQFSTAPGHLVKPNVLQKLRSTKPQEQCFYGNVKEGGQFPSSRDYRIAIVEGNPWIRVRLAGGVLGGGAEAKLALGIAFSGWPAGSDFPSRIPLGYSDAFMCYKVAQSGFYVVGGGPGTGVQWSERSAGWQVWTAGARSMLGSRGDGFAKVGKVCAAVLDHLRATGQPPLRAVSRFMIEEALLWRVEKTTGRGPGGILRSWSGSHLAHQVLCVFDTLLSQIKARTGRHYFFEGCDMVKMAVWRGARIGERDWRGDYDCLSGFLKRLHEESNQKLIEDVEILPNSQERLESALCCRWGLLLQELTPPGSTKGRRLAGAPTYSPRQIAYVAATSRELLAARQCVIQESNEWYQGSLTTTSNQYQDPIEDLIHLLAIILDQARDYFIKINYNNSAVIKSLIDAKPSTSYPNTSSKDTLKRQKMKTCFDAAATYLLDSVRRDPDTLKEDLSDDAVLIRILLKWLYKSIDEDKKYLSTVLKPYLEMLFVTSHENCWHLEELKIRVTEKELEGLMLFSKTVGDGNLSPADGILDAASKGWLWAESILDTLDNVSKMDSSLRMLFTSSDGKLLKFDLSLPNDPIERENWDLFHAKRYEGYTAKLKLAEKCVIEAFSYGLDGEMNSLESTVHTSRSEEILQEKYDFNYNSGSNTHTLKSTKSMSGLISGEFDNSNKYHTLRSLDSKYNTLRNSENLFGSSWSNGSMIKLKEKFKTPVVLGKLNSIDVEPCIDTLDDIEFSLHCNLRDLSPLNFTLSMVSQLTPHREYIGIIKALICMQKYSILQELAGWLGNTGEKTGALKALHRLARSGRRASGPACSLSKPTVHRHNYTLSPTKMKTSRQRASIRQYYRRRNIDALSGDESKKSDKRESLVTPRTQELLDIEVHKEYMENKTLHNEVERMAEMNERYMELCREAIRDSQAKLKKPSFSKFDKEIKNKIFRKESFRSSSVGRSVGNELQTRLEYNPSNEIISQTMGRSFGKEIQTSTSLLGTCRRARLHQVAKRSVLPRTTSTGDGLIGDSFKISPIYTGVQSEYDLMTQSILQYPNQQLFPDRQRQLTMSRDRLYP